MGAAVGGDQSADSYSAPALVAQSANIEDSIYEKMTLGHDGDDGTISVAKGGLVVSVPAQYAQGAITVAGAPVAAETFEVHSVTYTARASGAVQDEFNIGATPAETAANIAAMVNAGTDAANVKAWAWLDGATQKVIVEAKTAGTAPNSWTFTESLTNITMDGGGTLGGTHAGVAANTLAALNENKSLSLYGNTETTGSIFSDKGFSSGSAFATRSEFIHINGSETEISTREFCINYNHVNPRSLADDGSFNLPNASRGYGFFQIGNNQEYAQIAWTSAGVVTLIANSANVALADTDANLCFVTTGTQIAVKNRLGAVLSIMYDYTYTTP